MEKDKLWQGMIDNRMLLTAPQTMNTKAKDLQHPRILTKVKFEKIIKMQGESLDRSYPESYNITALSNYLHGNSNRPLNVKIQMDFIAKRIEIMQKKKGKKRVEEVSALEELRQDLNKPESGENLADRLLDKFGVKASGSDGGPAAKRLRWKTSDTAGKTDLVEFKVKYHYTLDHLRTRRVGDSPCAQGCARRSLKPLLPRTLDLDIENCQSVLLYQLVQKMEASLPSDVLETLRRLACERQEICADELQVDLPTGSLNLVCVRVSYLQPSHDSSRTTCGHTP